MTCKGKPESIFLKAALQYAKMNMAVFPVKSKGKTPLTAHGCLDATINREQIVKWWSRWPDANIGVAMGSKSGGLIAIDLDVDEDKGVNGYHVLRDWERENGELPETIMSITGRGGYHYIYRTNKDYKNAVGFCEGIDIRTNGGYIIVPPSVHPNGHSYEWEQAPEDYPIAQANELVERFLQGSRKEPEQRESFTSPELIPEGQRNATLYKMACSMRAKGYAETAIRAAVEAENEAKCQPSLNDREIDTIVKSALKYESGTKANIGAAEHSGAEESRPGTLDRFHLFNEKGKITGVFDYAIFEYIKAEHELFVLGGTPYLYDGGVYVPDETGAKLKTMIRELIYPAYIKSTTIKRIYELFISAAELQAGFEDVNQYPPHWVNFQNGFFDPKTGRMVPHDPKYKAINQLPHEYEPEAKPKGETVEAWLRFICPEADDREMLLQYEGLTGNRDVSQQKFLVFDGEGGSGKSTVIRMNEYMVGSRNVSNISLSELQQRFASFGLMGKLLNSCADLEIAALEDTSTLKKCLGEDTLRGEQKGKDAVSFKSYAKLIFSTNELPLVKAEKTNGFYRRLLVLPMNRVPEKKDADLFVKLSAEIDYFIHLSMDALQRMYKAGTITESRASVAAVNQLRCDSDTVSAFLTEECTEDRNGRVDRGWIYGKYKSYCENNERQPLSKNGFFKSMRSKNFREGKSGNERYFAGLVYGKKASSECPEKCPDGFISVTDDMREGLPFD